MPERAIRIVDLSTDVAGRFAAKLFAMAGANVVRPCTAQMLVPGDADSPLSLYLDAGKKAVRLDGETKLYDLLAGADLVFTSFDKGRYLGLAAGRPVLPATCSEVTTSSFGTTGPYAVWRGGPLADWSAGGYLAITGAPDREPLIGPENLCAYVCGYTAALGAEAALRARRISGLGQHVDVSTMETMLGLHQSTFSRLCSGHIRPRTGRYAEVYPLTVLPCRSGHVSLGIVTDEEFDRLAIAFGLPELVSDERFNTREARRENRDTLDQRLAEYLLQHDSGAVVEVLQANGVAAAEVVDPREVLANPQMQFRNFWASPDGYAHLAMPGNPLPPAKVFAAGGGDVRETGPEQPLAQPHRTTAGLPLDGITVLDFTAFWAGPSATRCLADLGANVIWVERPRSRLDFDEHIADPQMLAAHLYHQKMNRHKRSVVLDLETASGRETARQLASHADVVIENFRPGVADRLEIGPSELCSAFPRLVYVSLSGFGSTGPWGDWRSYGPNIEAASSILARTGYPDEGPMRMGHALPDGVGGVAGALAAMRGLRELDESGHGGWFDVSQLEVYTALSGEEILAASMSGADSPRIGNRSRQVAVQGVFPCMGNDQWITIRLTGQADVERFAAETGLAGIGNNPADFAAIEELIGTFTSERDKFALSTQLQNAGLEALPVFTPDELVTNPHAVARGSFIALEYNGQACMLPGSPLHSQPPLVDLAGRAPRFGEHTDEIVRALDPSAWLHHQG